MEEALRHFRDRLATWGIDLQAEDVRLRRAGFLQQEGWLIQYQFGRSGNTEHLRYYAFHHMAGDRARAMATLEELKGLSPGGNVAPFNLALLYRGLGDHARALDYLEQAYAANSQQVFWLKVDPHWNPLREEPRFRRC